MACRLLASSAYLVPFRPYTNSEEYSRSTQQHALHAARLSKAVLVDTMQVLYKERLPSLKPCYVSNAQNLRQQIIASSVAHFQHPQCLTQTAT
jgi:hypothetical protein